MWTAEGGKELWWVARPEGHGEVGPGVCAGCGGEEGKGEGVMVVGSPEREGTGWM